MSDVNNRLMAAVTDIMRTHPGTSPELALRFALEGDRELATAYHQCGSDGAIDPGIAPPEPRGTVRDIPIVTAGPRRHFSELSAVERARELTRLGHPTTVVHKLCGGAEGGFYTVPTP